MKKCSCFLSTLLWTSIVFTASSNAQVSSTGQLWSGVISAGRAIDWTNAGVTGGVPARTTVCQTVSLTTGSGAAATNTSAIQSAISSCSGKNQTVSLPAGTYYINGISFGSSTNVTVRGQGADSTFLLINSGASGCNLQAAVCFSGPNNSVGAEQNVCDWTGGYAQGSTSITVANCGSSTPARGSLSNLHVGTILVLDQVDEAHDTGAIWNCASNGQAGDANCATTVQAGFARTDGTSASGVTMRAQQQTVIVTGVSGNTVTISSGLYMPNWRSGQAPQAWYGSTVGPTGDGIEDVTLDNTAQKLGSGTFLIAFSNVANDWASGVRGLYGGRDHVVMQYSNHITVQHSYFYQSVSHATVSYTMEQIDSADNLVQNNICQQVTDSCPNTGGAGEGDVALYNFAVDDVYNSSGWMQASFYQHSAGDVYGLWEGNIGTGYSSDDVHGTHYFETLYRNYLPGNQNAGCGSASAATCTAETIPIQMWAGSRYFNIVGNVLGRTGYHTGYQYNGSSSGSGNPAAHYIYALGATGNSGAAGGISVFCTSPACTATGPYDPQTYNSVLKWGNYDTVTNGVRWCGGSANTGWSSICSSVSEIPSSLTACPSIVCTASSLLSNILPTVGDTGAGQDALPASLYYSSTPSWWPSGAAWPSIGPDVASGTVGICSGGTYANMPALTSAQCTGGTLVTGLGGHVNANPAMACYLNTMGGPPDGTGPALSFNANTCYGAGTSSGTKPSPATGVKATANQN